MVSLANRVVVRNALIWKHRIWNLFGTWRLVIISSASLPRFYLALNWFDVAFANISRLDCFYKPEVFPKKYRQANT